MRTERAVEDIVGLSADTSITFKLKDLVDAVERGLPAGYPAVWMEGLNRRDVVGSMATEILASGKYA
ncbi:hypothetical protein SSPIM334S_06997 [Streptomyces spiroverticillatus]|uniref:hypothetical protein n=1 Tax=Streptomyces finlayi TaxID=67296 RepID=UPI001674AEE4|nr:hypothetical protein [Streptomyces finlayi]